MFDLLRTMRLAGRYRWRWFLLPVLLCCAVFIADAIAGRFVPSNSRSLSTRSVRTLALREYPPNLDTVVAPSEAYVAKSQGLSFSPKTLRTDEAGFISPPKSQTVLHGPDIIFFGGSTTECLYVEEENRFPARVAELLQRADGGAVRTANAGVSGNHCIDSLLALIGKGIPAKPRVVVLMECFKDLSFLSESGSYWDLPPSRQILQNPAVFQAPPAPFKAWLRSTAEMVAPNLFRIALASSTKLAIFFDSSVSLTAMDEAWHEAASARSVPLETCVAQFSSSLASFVRVARAWGITPVLMTQFNRLRPQDDFVRREYEKNPGGIPYQEFIGRYSLFNETVREVARKEGCLLVDLDRDLQPAADYLYDFVNLNDAGSLQVATLVSRTLVEHQPQFWKLRDPQDKPPRNSVSTSSE